MNTKSSQHLDILNAVEHIFTTAEEIGKHWDVLDRTQPHNPARRKLVLWAEPNLLKSNAWIVGLRGDIHTEFEVPEHGSFHDIMLTKKQIASLETHCKNIKTQCTPLLTKLAKCNHVRHFETQPALVFSTHHENKGMQASLVWNAERHKHTSLQWPCPVRSAKHFAKHIQTVLTMDKTFQANDDKWMIVTRPKSQHHQNHTKALHHQR